MAAAPQFEGDAEARPLAANDLDGLGRGAVWSGLSSIVLRAGTFITGIVTARILAPSELGVFAVALTVHIILISLSELGVGAAVTRHTGDVRKVAATLATVSVLTSALLAAAMALAAPVLATALGSEAATDAVRILSLTLVINGFSTVPAALLARDFRQDKRFLAEVAAFVVSTAVLLLLLWRGWGPVGLAWSRVAGVLVFGVAVNAMAPARRRFAFDPAEAVRLLRFGVPLAAAGLVGLTLGSLDYIVVGRTLGGEVLGLYVLAYTISGWPISIFTSIVMGVGVPAFSRVRDDTEHLPQHVTAALQALLTLALPVSALTMALAAPLIAAVYGTKWDGAVPVLVVLAVFGAVRVPIDLFANILVAMGRTKTLLWVQLAWIAALVPVMVAAVDLEGAVGAAWAHVAIAVGLVVPMYVSLLRRLTGVRARALLRAAARPATAAGVAGLGAHLVAREISAPWVSLVAGGIVGLASYLACLGPGLSQLRTECRTMWGPSRPDETGLPAVVAVEAP